MKVKLLSCIIIAELFIFSSLVSGNENIKLLKTNDSIEISYRGEKIKGTVYKIKNDRVVITVTNGVVVGCKRKYLSRKDRIKIFPKDYKRYVEKQKKTKAEKQKKAKAEKQKIETERRTKIAKQKKEIAKKEKHS